MSDGLDALAFAWSFTDPALLAEAEDEWTGMTRVERLAELIRRRQVTYPTPIRTLVDEMVPRNEVHMFPERLDHTLDPDGAVVVRL